MRATTRVPGRIRRRQSFDTHGLSALPDWVSKVGGSSTTLTFNDNGGGGEPASLQVECANVDGGLVGGPINADDVAEIRVEAAFRTDTPPSGSNTVQVALVSSTASIDAASQSVKLYQYDTTEMGFNSKGGPMTRGLLPSVKDGEWQYLSVTVGPATSEAGISVAPETPSEYVEVPANIDPGTTYYPAVGLNTSNDGTTENIWVAHFGYEVVHN